MDWFPLYNSVRIAGIATVITFFAGILCETSEYIKRYSRLYSYSASCYAANGYRFFYT